MIVQSIKLACSNCNLRELCIPLALNEEELQKLDGLVTTRRKVPRGETLYRNGERFSALYAIIDGDCAPEPKKTSTILSTLTKLLFTVIIH